MSAPPPRGPRLRERGLRIGRFEAGPADAILWAAPEIAGREGRVAPALPHDDVLELLDAHGRLAR